MSCRGTRREKPVILSNVRHIRVYVRPRDVPRWNRIFEKSGKTSNPALLEWLMQLAEERLNLNAEQSRQEWNQQVAKIKNGGPRSDPDRDEDDTSHDFGDNAEDMELGHPPGVFQNGRLSSSPPSSQDSELIGSGIGNQRPVTSNVGGGPPDPLRLAETERADPHVNVMDEQITVEKKGSNAPIRKRFRLRVSSASSDVPAGLEANHQTFREPLKVRRKTEKSIGGEAVQGLPMTLRSREKLNQSSSGQPERNGRSRTNPALAMFSDKARVPPDPEQSSTPNDGIDDNPVTAEPGKAAAGVTEQSTRKKDGHGKQTTFPCSKCPRVFKNAGYLGRHEEAHNKEPISHACDSCDKTFTTPASLWHHRKSKHVEKNIPCPHCNRRFAVLRLLKLHLRNHTGEKPYQCKYCEMRFTLKSTLRNHESTHSALKHFLCDTCGESFRRKDNLTNHIARRHKNQKVYKCNTCEKTFHSKDTFTNHQIHHQNEEHGKAPYKCNMCDKEFTTPNGLKDHIARHRLRKDHVCETCGKVFKMKYYLTKHQAIHLKVKPYVCTTCDKRFTQKSNLDIHMRTHTGVKPYVCTECGKAFAHNVSLKGHVSTSHSGSGGKQKASKEAPSMAPGQSQQRKPKKTPSNYNRRGDVVPSIEISDHNPDASSESSQVIIATSLNEDVPETNMKLEDRQLPSVDQRVSEETMEAGRRDEISDLVIDEHQYSQDLPDLNNSLTVAVDNPRDSGIPQDISYNLTGLLPPSIPSTHTGTDKVQYVTSSSLATEVTPRPLSSARPDNSMSQQNNVLEASTPPIPPHSHLENLVQADLRAYEHHHHHPHPHPGNLGSYTRHPLGSPPLNHAASASVHQQENSLHPPLDQNRLTQPLPTTVPSHEDLSPAPIAPQNDAVSPLPLNIQVDNGVHQVQASGYSQNINFIPSFHPQPQQLTLSTQSSPLLPNMIRKEQPVLVEGLPQNYAAMIPIRTLMPEASAQMAQDQRLNLPAGNLQPTNQSVHFPFRSYIEYSQSPSEAPQDRPNDLPAVSHFSKLPQTNLPPSRVTPSRQSFSYNTNYAAAVVSATIEEQTRGTPSFGNAAGQRSPAFVNPGAIESVKEVDGNMVQGGEAGGWRPLDARWDSPHVHQIPVSQGRDMSNLPPQLHRQLLSEYSRKLIPFPTTVSSQQLMWESASSQGLG